MHTTVCYATCYRPVYWLWVELSDNLWPVTIQTLGECVCVCEYVHVCVCVSMYMCVCVCEYVCVCAYSLEKVRLYLSKHLKCCRDLFEVLP